jgi:hypothetical protein
MVDDVLAGGMAMACLYAIDRWLITVLVWQP